jgi:hypothetical protein
VVSCSQFSSLLCDRDRRFVTGKKKSMKAVIKKVSARTKEKLRYLLATKNTNQNLYHCCIQKTGSQWLKKIFSDSIFYGATSLEVFSPKINYLNPVFFEEVVSHTFPIQKIITPLYIRYDEFQLMSKPDDYKAVFIMRDYRDVIVSDYFSYRYSHPIAGRKFMAERREQLNAMSEDEGIMLTIQDVKEHKSTQIEALMSWVKARDDKRILICQFEELIGDNFLIGFQQIFDHFDIKISEKNLQDLLSKYSFEKLSGGRESGKENQQSHYRKGVAGDWKNYFKESHKTAFKEMTDDLLVQLGYERDMNW